MNAKTNSLPAACRGHRRRRCGWITAEVAFSLGVLGILMTVFAGSQNDARQSNAVQLFRQQCLSAAEAQLDSLAAAGRPLDAAEIHRLWPGVRTAVEQTPGLGDWEGLTLATVTAQGQTQGRDVKVRLARYLPAQGDRP